MRTGVEALGRTVFNSSPFRFALVGTLAFCIDATVLELLIRSLAISPLIARVFSWTTAASSAWYLNRRFTFRLPASDGLTSEWIRYLMANGVGGGANYAVFAALVTSVAVVQRQPVFGVAAGALTGMAFNYAASRFWVFRRYVRA